MQKEKLSGDKTVIQSKMVKMTRIPITKRRTHTRVKWYIAGTSNLFNLNELKHKMKAILFVYIYIWHIKQATSSIRKTF